MCPVDMKRVLYLLLIIGIGAACRRGPDQKTSATSTTMDSRHGAVVLQIGDHALTNEAFKEFVRLQYASAAQTAANNRLLSRLFDQFVEQELLLYQARRENVTISDEEIADYDKQLPDNPQSTAQRPNIRNVLMVQKFLYFRVYQDIHVTDREVEQYYNNRIEEYRKGEEILLYQIMVPDHDHAMRLHSELLGNPNRFEEIARRESKSPEAAKGGLMGYFEKGVLPNEMENIVFSLPVGVISPITETPYGFHIFKVTKIKKKRLLAFATVAPEIRDRLLADRLRTAQQLFLTDLRKRLNITVKTENLYFPYVQSNSDEVKNETVKQTPAAPADASADQS